MQYCRSGIKACSHGVVCADASNKVQFEHLNVAGGQILIIQQQQKNKTAKVLKTFLSNCLKALLLLTSLQSKILDN